MNKDDPATHEAIKIQRLHLIATGKVCALPPPQEVVDLYIHSERAAAARKAKELALRAEWDALSPEAKEKVRGFIDPKLLRGR